MEVIEKGHVTRKHPVPLLFVPGTGHGAWSWDEHFLDYFADNGFRAVAMNLRGHGRSPTAKPLKQCSIGDFVDDVHSVAQSMPDAPVVIGHSLGGYVIQKYLESHRAPAGVLLASLPPAGSRAATLRRLKRHPWLFAKATLTGRQLPGLTPPQLAREAFFSPSTPEAVVVDCSTRLQEESTKALAQTLLPRGVDPNLVTTPLLVLGAEHDGGVSAAEVRATARAYRTEAEFFPDMGHDMMLEPGWRAVAERIESWLGGRGL